MDLPLILKTEIHELANGVVLTISNEARPSPSDPMAQRHLKVGPLHFDDVETALDSVSRLAREALNARRERDEWLVARMRTGGEESKT